MTISITFDLSAIVNELLYNVHLCDCNLGLDTCLYHMIHQSYVRLLLFVVGNCQTLSKDGPSQLVNSIIFRPFFLYFASDVHRFLPIMSCSNVRPPRVLHIVFMFINRQLFISPDIQSCDGIFGFLRKR